MNLKTFCVKAFTLITASYYYNCIQSRAQHVIGNLRIFSEAHCGEAQWQFMVLELSGGPEICIRKIEQGVALVEKYGYLEICLYNHML